VIELAAVRRCRLLDRVDVILVGRVVIMMFVETSHARLSCHLHDSIPSQGLESPDARQRFSRSRHYGRGPECGRFGHGELLGNQRAWLPQGAVPRSPYVTTTCCRRPFSDTSHEAAAALAYQMGVPRTLLCAVRGQLWQGRSPKATLNCEYPMSTTTTQPGLVGSVALITGGGRGGGGVLALALAGAGAVVGLIARSSDQLVESSAAGTSKCCWPDAGSRSTT
jgi:hypothetical protein